MLSTEELLEMPLSSSLLQLSLKLLLFLNVLNSNDFYQFSAGDLQTNEVEGDDAKEQSEVLLDDRKLEDSFAGRLLLDWYGVCPYTGTG